MTYERLFQLKFKEEVPTHQLGKQFPRERKKISRLALLELPLSRLRKVVRNREEFQKLLLLKEWLIKRSGMKSAKKRGACLPDRQGSAESCSSGKNDSC